MFWPLAEGQRLAEGTDEAVDVAVVPVAVVEDPAAQVCEVTVRVESSSIWYTLRAFPAPQYSEESPVQVMSHFDESMIALPVLKQLPQ